MSSTTRRRTLLAGFAAARRPPAPVAVRPDPRTPLGRLARRYEKIYDLAVRASARADDLAAGGDAAAARAANDDLDSRILPAFDDAEESLASAMKLAGIPILLVGPRALVNTWASDDHLPDRPQQVFLLGRRGDARPPLKLSAPGPDEAEGPFEFEVSVPTSAGAVPLMLVFSRGGSGQPLRFARGWSLRCVVPFAPAAPPRDALS